MQRTFFMVKPDGVQRGLIGEIIARIEKKGLKIIAMKMIKISREMARKHYAKHVNKDFYPELEDFITSGPVVAVVVEGNNAVEVIRSINGETDPVKALPGTIRGDFSINKTMNTVHGSDSVLSARDEINLFFTENELISYNRDLDRWI